jgi:hypothetical protein
MVLGASCLVLLAGLGVHLEGGSAAMSSGSEEVKLPYSLINGAGFPWFVEDGNGLTIKSSFAFDQKLGCFRLTVGGELFKESQAKLDMEGQELIVGPKTMAKGLKVTREIFVPKDEKFIRFREVIENPGGEAKVNLKLTCHLAPIPSGVAGLERNMTPSPYLGDQEVKSDDFFVTIAIEPDTFEKGFEALPWERLFGKGKQVRGQGPLYQCDLNTLKPINPENPQAWQVVETEEERGKVAQAGAIPDETCTALKLELETQKGDIRFQRKISSESYDTLQFFIDGQLRGWWSGEEDWAEAVCQNGCRVGEGKHTFIWAYQKSFAGSGGQDTAWIDDVQLPLRSTFLWVLFSPEAIPAEEPITKPTTVQRNRNTLTVEYSGLTIPAKDKVVIIHFGAQYLQSQRIDLDQLNDVARSWLKLEGIAAAGIEPVNEIGPTFSGHWYHDALPIEEGAQLKPTATGESICLQITGERIVQYAHNLPFCRSSLKGNELNDQLGNITIEIVDENGNVAKTIISQITPRCIPIEKPCTEATKVEVCFRLEPKDFQDLQKGRKYYFKASSEKVTSPFLSPYWTF